MRRYTVIIGMLFILLVVAVGGYGILTAPSDKMTDDQKQLQSELEQNEKAMRLQGKEPFPEVFSPAEPSPGKPAPTELSPTESSPVESFPGEPTQKASGEEKGKDKNGLPDMTPQPEPGSFEFTAIGDSVMLSAYPKLKETFPDSWIDAAESRQVRDSLEIAEALDSQNRLKNIVIIALGTNGAFHKPTGQELLNYLGTQRTVYWVTAYGKSLQWQDNVNSEIRDLANENPNLHIIDWAGIASEHPEWFRDDGVHLKSEGEAEYVNFIRENLS